MTISKCCSRCGELKLIGEFYPDKRLRSGRRSECKTCMDATSRKWQEEDPKRAKATKRKSARKWREENPDKYKNGRLQRDHGITLDEYNEIFAAQKGMCAMCGEAMTGGKKAFPVDHDHSKKGRGSIRGIMHQRCNALLGMCRERIEVLQAAIDFLKRFEGIQIRLASRNPGNGTAARG